MFTLLVLLANGQARRARLNRSRAMVIADRVLAGILIVGIGLAVLLGS
jgi:threonine/homoserine/homoserine lactone efflux protein